MRMKLSFVKFCSLLVSAKNLIQRAEIEIWGVTKTRALFEWLLRGSLNSNFF